MTIMSTLLSRNGLISVWILIFGLIAAFELPMTFATGLLLLISGLAGPTVAILLWKAPPQTIAEVLNRAER